MSKIEDSTTTPSLVEAAAVPPSLPTRLVMPGDARRAALMLLLATVAWSFSFVWAKETTAAINESAGLPAGSLFSAAALQATRFALASVFWLVLFRRARRGWTLAAHLRAALLGVLLATGLVLQTVGLDLTSEAVSAFLTSLASLFVPLIVAVFFGIRPTWLVGVAVLIALGGVYLLTGASLRSLGTGEWMGIVCSVVFAAHLVLLNRLTNDDSPWRMAAGQFVWVAASLGVVAIVTVPPSTQFQPAALVRIGVWGQVLALALLPTLFSFGVMTLYQPRVDPTRAAMIYLLEPVFASGVAWVLAGRGLDAAGLLGATLILLANAMVELRSYRTSA